MPDPTGSPAPTLPGTPPPTPGPTGGPCTGTPPGRGGDYHVEGCLATFAGNCRGGLRLPEDAHSLAPWVAITFEGTGSTITVGNDSSPATDPKHVACIKSFEFGYSDGLTCRVTIVDEQGGSFVQFMHNLLKNFVCMRNGSPASVRMVVQFGWIKTGCDAPLPTAISRCYYCLSDSVESNFVGGKFIFEITGKDLIHRAFEGGATTIYGGEGASAVPITQAIRKFMTEDCPPNVGSVRFCRMEGGSCVPCPFKTNGVEGPKGKWIASGQDKLRVVMRWLEGHLSDRDRSWIPQYNSELRNGELIFWEDSKPRTPQGDSYWDQNCLGTYIYNGGKHSAVLEFSPKIRWDFARLTSVGGALGTSRLNSMGTPGAATPGTPGVPRTAAPCAGHTVGTTSTETHRDGGSTTREVADANAEAGRALKILHDNIEADLTIVGDPTVLPPSEAMWSKNVTVIVVNPYFIRFANFVEAVPRLEWLSTPVCNEVLSSKAWICKSVTHRIEAGKYTTTIGLFLTAPGIDAPPGSPIGNWTGGWVPRPQC